jgi:hypothetical protein
VRSRDWNDESQAKGATCNDNGFPWHLLSARRSAIRARFAPATLSSSPAPPRQARTAARCIRATRASRPKVILDRIDAALRELGASLEDVVETRIYVTDMSLWPAVGAAHGEVFKDIRPASTLVQIGPLIFPGLLVEISAIAATL